MHFKQKGEMPVAQGDVITNLIDIWELDDQS
jgi:hypothetical protein